MPLDGNPERQFYYKHSFMGKSAPLDFGPEELQALEKLEEYEERGNAFRLLREAANSPLFYSRFSMLVAALEAIAGEKIGDRGPERNREYIRDVILKDTKLERQLFKMRTGIRNQILHGQWIDENEHGGKDYIGKIYDAIRRYFRDNYNIVLEMDVVDPMRNPHENFLGWRQWLKPKSEEVVIDIKELWDMSVIDYENPKSVVGQGLNDLYIFLVEPPKGL